MYNNSNEVSKMKKISSALLKAATLLLSFSGIAISIILRDLISLPLMIATILISLLLIGIVISLLVKEEPQNTATAALKKPVAQEKTVQPKLPVEEVEAITEATPTPKEKKKSKRFTLLPSGDIVLGHRENTTETIETPTIDLEVPSAVEYTPAELEPEIIVKEQDKTNVATSFEPIPSPYTIGLKLNDEEYENLISLMDDMEKEKQIIKNSDFNNFDLLPHGIKYYQYIYHDIPVVSLIKQRDGSFNVMCGVNNQNLHQISTLTHENFNAISHIYENSSHIQCILNGGRYRLIDLETQEEIEVSEPHKVQIRLYHSLNKSSQQ